MRSKKKVNIDAFYDNMPKSRSKQMVPKYEPRTDNQKKGATSFCLGASGCSKN